MRVVSADSTYFVRASPLAGVRLIDRYQSSMIDLRDNQNVKLGAI